MVGVEDDDDGGGSDGDTSVQSCTCFAYTNVFSATQFFWFVATPN